MKHQEKLEVFNEAKAEAEAPEEFEAVYYVDYVKEVQKNA